MASINKIKVALFTTFTLVFLGWAVSGAVSKDFVEGIVTMYVYANNAIREFRPNKNFIISVLKNKEQEINKFIDTDRTNFKKTKDVVRLINYYNSLL